jgi:regulatory associated protein of mTOR
MSVDPISKVYYRQSRLAHYLHQLDVELVGGFAEEEESLANNGATPNIQSTNRTSIVHNAIGIRRGSSVQALLSSVAGVGLDGSSQLQQSQQSIALTPQRASMINNEADTAAGSAISIARRVSSFQLLHRSSSTETIARSPSTLFNINVNNYNKSNNIGGILSPNRPGGIDDDQSNSGVLSLVEQRRRRQMTYSNSRIPANAIRSSPVIKPDWCLRDGKMKTVGIGLILCLSIGVDPPDLVKPNPCAVLECWLDPRPVGGMSRTKAREMIGERLERQYAKWQLARTAKTFKFRKAIDPIIEDVRTLCIRLRSQARNERILIHYNGHGVPRPTDRGGELWVFDKGHTEYITVSVADLRQWMGKPSLVVLDCSGAGILIPFWTEAARLANATEKQQEKVKQESKQKSSPGGVGQKINNEDDAGNDDANNIDDSTMDDESNSWVHDTMLLCPCSEGEWLPLHPDYPADIFTSCLTTPIPIALRWFIRQNRATSIAGTLHPDVVDQIPGLANDRKTPLGELNWIFTGKTVHRI